MLFESVYSRLGCCPVGALEAHCNPTDNVFAIQTPSGCINERAYTLCVLFGDWLGIPFTLSQSTRGDVSIRLVDQPGEILLPEIFFAQFMRGPNTWLTAASLPQLSFPQWDTRELAPNILLTAPLVPVPFGDERRPTFNANSRQSPTIHLPIDIIGAAFFMLSRYEEAVLPDRDQHDRFPASASLAYQAGFLDRPIIDEYLEILWSAMQRLWPELKRKPRQPRTLVTCDVDCPFAYTGSLKRVVRDLAGDLLIRRSPSLAFQTCRGHWRANQGDHRHDQHFAGLGHIMAVNERAGRAVAFNFIPENTDPRFDDGLGLDDPRLRALLREIHARGHEIGIHPGYQTYRQPNTFTRSVATLRRALAEEGIIQPELGGRQHYLRWETPTTAILWDESGLDYDSTLSFADRPGFRCGTCHEYLLYDLHHRRALSVHERPLIVMECSVIADRYLGLGYSEPALALMQGYRNICHQFGGDFTLLWHNSHFNSDEDFRFYEALVG